MNGDLLSRTTTRGLCRTCEVSYFFIEWCVQWLKYACPQRDHSRKRGGAGRERVKEGRRSGCTRCRHSRQARRTCSSMVSRATRNSRSRDPARSVCIMPRRAAETHGTQVEAEASEGAKMHRRAGAGEQTLIERREKAGQPRSAEKNVRDPMLTTLPEDFDRTHACAAFKMSVISSLSPWFPTTRNKW